MAGNLPFRVEGGELGLGEVVGAAGLVSVGRLFAASGRHLPGRCRAWRPARGPRRSLYSEPLVPEHTAPPTSGAPTRARLGSPRSWRDERRRSAGRCKHCRPPGLLCRGGSRGGAVRPPMGEGRRGSHRGWGAQPGVPRGHTRVPWAWGRSATRTESTGRSCHRDGQSKQSCPGTRLAQQRPGPGLMGLVGWRPPRPFPESMLDRLGAAGFAARGVLGHLPRHGDRPT